MSKEVDSMSFLEHLEVLRWHIIRSVIAVFCFGLIAFLSKSIIFDVILFGPSRLTFPTYQWLCALGKLTNIDAICIDNLPFIIQSRKLTGQFSMHITASLVVGIIISFPYIFWEIWRFVKPALYTKEEKGSKRATFSVSLLFMLGVLFGYFILTPFSIYFLANYQVSAAVINEFDIVSYVSTIATLVLASGIVFQLPVLVYFLSYAGLITPELMRHYQKHAIVVILFFSALITPPDVFSQVFIAIPILLLYRFSILISASVQKKFAAKKLNESGEGSA